MEESSSSSKETSKQIVLAPRKDAPAINYSRRASKELALSAASSKEAKEAAMGELESDVLANSAKDSRRTLLKTWEEFHYSWFGESCEMLPLTLHKIRCVGAMFKKGGYRSFKNYLSAVKDLHIMTGHPWTIQLDRSSRNVSRSVLRGIGPARQAGTMDVSKLPLTEVSVEPVVEGGPIGPLNLIIVGSFWLTREIEISLALTKNVFFVDHD